MVTGADKMIQTGDVYFTRENSDISFLIILHVRRWASSVPGEDLRAKIWYMSAWNGKAEYHTISDSRWLRRSKWTCARFFQVEDR